jgi:phage baseplate assembly protein W
MMINWSPTTAEEVVQNVNTLLATAPGTVPLSRLMGTPQDMVDQPESLVGAQVSAAVIKAVRTYEPRAKITGTQITATDAGKLTITAQLAGVK